MAIPVKSAFIGTCPHGLPGGACPICSGMGGGGSASKKPVKNEMSWSECYAIGQEMKAAKQRLENQKNLDVQNMQNAVLLARIADSIAQRVMPVINFINNSLITPVKTLANFAKQVFSNIAKPFINVASQIANNIKESLKNISEKFVEISDKLAAIFGSEEVEKKDRLSDIFKKLRIKDYNPFVEESNNDGDGGSGGGFYFSQEDEEEEENDDNV